MKLLVNAGIAKLFFSLHNYFERVIKMNIYKFNKLARICAESAKSLTFFIGLISVFILFFVYSIAHIFAQNNAIDTLLTLLKTDKCDTTQVIHLYQLCAEYRKAGNYEKGLQYGKEALEMGTKLNYKKAIANSYNNIGSIYTDQGNYPEVHPVERGSLFKSAFQNWKLEILIQ